MHNATEAPFGRRLENFPKTVVWMKEVADRFLNALHCIESCFIGDETLELLPEASIVGQTRVGGRGHQSFARVHFGFVSM